MLMQNKTGEEEWSSRRLVHQRGMGILYLGRHVAAGGNVFVMLGDRQALTLHAGVLGLAVSKFTRELYTYVLAADI